MFVAEITDHITPWKGVYDSAHAFGGKTDFVLSGGGHIQNLITPRQEGKALSQFAAWLFGRRLAEGAYDGERLTAVVPSSAGRARHRECDCEDWQSTDAQMSLSSDI
jgi:hypothetical protein